MTLLVNNVDDVLYALAFLVGTPVAWDPNKPIVDFDYSDDAQNHGDWGNFHCLFLRQ